MRQRSVQPVGAQHLDQSVELADPSAMTDRLQALGDQLDIGERRLLHLGREPLQPPHTGPVVPGLAPAEQQAHPKRVRQWDAVELPSGVQRKLGVPG